MSAKKGILNRLSHLRRSYRNFSSNIFPAMILGGIGWMANSRPRRLLKTILEVVRHEPLMPQIHAAGFFVSEIMIAIYPAEHRGHSNFDINNCCLKDNGILKLYHDYKSWPC